ncbi:iron-containing alcohol dehydrogenase [Clostridia bacterium]|nr:iron-containing alcohol dehydrogenase [Clostridia bacterium]
MQNFEFYNPTRILFGQGQIKNLDAQIPKDATVLILYGGGSIKKNGILDQVTKALGDRKYLEFSGIEANPSYYHLIKSLDIIKKEKVDFLLAVGGGSVIDGTKFINLAANYEGDDPVDLLLNPESINSIKTSTPIGVVLTLPATGSEMNRTAVISYDKGKFPVFCELNFPKFSILDPTVTYTLPATQVANGIVDTFIHTVEQYVTYPSEGRFQDRTAEGILQTLIEIGKKTIDNPEDYDARANLMWCATMGLNGLIGAGVPQDWSTHGIGHELTALFGIDHGKTLAILQPAIWDVRRKQKHEKLLQYAERVWGIEIKDEKQAIDHAIAETRTFFESLGIATHLSDYGIGKKDIDLVIANLEKHNQTTLSETGDLGLDQSREILEKSL